MPQRDGAKSIALDLFPKAKQEWIRPNAEEQYGRLQEVIVALREIRATMKVDLKKKVAAEFSSVECGIQELIENNREPVMRLAGLSELRISGEPLATTGGTLRSTARFDVRVALSEAVDVAAERARLQKELTRLDKDIESKTQRLADQTFLSKAPGDIINGLRNTLIERKLEHSKVELRLKQIEGNI